MPIAVVTGASRGLGKALAEALARAGYRTYAAMRQVGTRNAEAAEAMANLAAAEAITLRTVEMDVTSDASVDAAIAHVLRAEGRIDVAVNNAGRGAHGVLEAFTVDQLREEIDLGVLSMQRLNRAVLPTMRSQGAGLLVHISSVTGRTVTPLRGVYHIAKHAVEALAETYRYELSQFGIDSVIIEPGPFETGAHGRVALPDAPQIQAQYGELAGGREVAMAGFNRMFADPSVPTDPQIFVDEVMRIIATPAGQRPLRTTVGVDMGVGAFNEAAAVFNHRAMQLMGLAHLEHMPPAKT